MKNFLFGERNVAEEEIICTDIFLDFLRAHFMTIQLQIV